MAPSPIPTREPVNLKTNERKEHIMRIDFNTTTPRPSFQKVNEKYLKKAEEWYRRRGNITGEWYNSLRDDVTLFKEISPQDGVDTMMAAKKYVNEGSMGFFNHVLECIKRG